MISDTVQMLNMIFNLQFLAIVIYFLTLFDLYFFAFGWQNRVSIGLNLHFLDVFLTSLIHNIFQIILIVWVCETGKNQAHKIGTTIHDLLNSTNDEKIKSEVTL